MQPEWPHTTVLLEEAADAVLHAPVPCDAPSRTYVDATFGRGGHSRRLLALMRDADRLVALDRDPQAIEAARAITDARFEIRHAAFSSLSQWAAHEGACIDGLLLDLGVSSPQIDQPLRGFSFRHDGPLDMRMDPTQGESAAQWLAQASQAAITEVIREFGEERFAPAIARAIVERRARGEALTRTAELARLVAAVVRTREPGQDPATRTFQALRMHVNDELGELRAALHASLTLLRPGGRLVVIAFHSLEDRMVKRFIASQARPVIDRRAAFAPVADPALIAIERVMPSALERERNPRARSAVMRVAERTQAAPLALDKGPA